MTPYNAILELASQMNNHTLIANTTGVSRKTVYNVLALANDYGFVYSKEDHLSDIEIHRILHPKRDTDRMPNIEETVFRISLLGTSIAKEWADYADKCRAVGITPYSKAQYQNILAESKDKYRISAGNQPVELRLCKDVVSVNGTKYSILFAFAKSSGYVSSGYVIAEVLTDRTPRSCVHAFNRLLRELGGVPASVAFLGKIPSDVIEAMTDCAAYYGCNFKEVSLKNGSKEFRSWISEQTKRITDQHLNEDLVLSTVLIDACNVFNDRYVFPSGHSFTRTQAFLIEHQQYSALPEKPFNLFEVVDAKVQGNYHIEVDGMFYSVPFWYRAEERLLAVVSDELIQIWVPDIIIAEHRRLTGRKGQYSTNSEHIPDDLEIPLGEISGTMLRKWAAKIGPNTLRAVEYWLSSRPYEVQAYKLCNTVLHMSTDCGADALEEACARAIHQKDISYRTVKAMLKGKRIREQSAVDAEILL